MHITNFIQKSLKLFDKHSAKWVYHFHQTGPVIVSLILKVFTGLEIGDWQEADNQDLFADIEQSYDNHEGIEFLADGEHVPS